MRGVRYVNCPTSLLAMVDASTGGKTGINTPQGKNLVGSFYTPAGVLADLRTLTSLPPTSLLAMVDASTGGKTGINTPQGKNLVGSFYTPAGVLADLRTLTSLPNDIFIEGLGEVAKSGFIRDPEILAILEEHANELRAFDGETFLDSSLKPVVAELIERTVRVKAHHVSADLKEAGLREFLNYGHTFGHAIEQLEHFRWRHGNAVAVGMVYAAELSNLTGHLDRQTVEYTYDLLDRLGLPTSWNGADFDAVLALMHRDKKARGNTLRFVGLEKIGKPFHLNDPDAQAVRTPTTCSTGSACPRLGTAPISTRCSP